MSTDFKGLTESQGGGYYHCEVCKLTFKNSLWRQVDPERTTCQNGHSKVNMLWFPTMTDKLLYYHGKKEPQIDELKGKGGEQET